MKCPVAAAAATKRTLDVHHTQRITELEHSSGRIADLRQRLAHIDERLNECDVGDMMRLKDERIAALEQLAELEEQGDTTSYLTDTASILFKYYNVVDNGGGARPTSTAPRNAKSILHFLNASSVGAKAVAENKPPPEDRGSLLDKYMASVDQNHVKQGAGPCDAQCSFCGSRELSLLTNDAMTVCKTCHSTEPVIMDHDKPSYKDPKKEVSYFSYKRINHLREWIAQVQGKETTDIPEEIYDKIMFEIGKQRITNIADLTDTKIRAILKGLKLTKYYEHAAHIRNRLNGLPAMHIPPELESKLEMMFKMIQSPFMRHCPAVRKNFLSYSYVLHKSLQLLEKDEYLPNFKLLRSREKLWAQDVIWKKICQDLNWQFIPSL